MGPDWLGSPQHFVAGVIVASAVMLVARRWVGRWWLLAALAVGTTMTAETLVELVEYPLLYSGRPHASAYWDTLADLAATLAGAVVGAGLGLAALHRRAPPQSR